MNSRNLIRAAASSLACLILASILHAQAAAPGANKIAVLNVRQAIASTAEGKQASAELQSQFASRQKEAENLNKQINDLRQRLEACQSTCSDDEKQRLTVQGQRLSRQFDRKNNELNEDAQAAQGEVVDRLGRKMIDVLDRFARDKGYVLVVDSSAQNSPLLYALPAIDITQEVIKAYDQAYPAKGTTSTPAPAKPAPAAPKPTTPPATKP